MPLSTSLPNRVPADAQARRRLVLGADGCRIRTPGVSIRRLALGTGVGSAGRWLGSGIVG